MNSELILNQFLRGTVILHLYVFVCVLDRVGFLRSALQCVLATPLQRLKLEMEKRTTLFGSLEIIVSNYCTG